MVSLTVPSLLLIFLLTGSFGLLVDCVGMYDSVFGSMTWVGDYGSTIPWVSPSINLGFSLRRTRDRRNYM